MIEATSFRPVAWLPGPHLQTIVPSLCSGPAVDGVPERIVLPVEAGSAVAVDIDRPRGAARAAGTLLLLHGLGGCSESAYMRRTARAALAAGWVTARMNLRNCGGTERLAASLYNAGQSGDVGRVLEGLEAIGLPRPHAAAGFSLGGNLVLLYAGRAGAGCLADAVAAVNPPIDLEACARALELARNRLYQVYYVRRLKRQLARIAVVRPLAHLPGPHGPVRSVRDFDQFYTAPDAGFASAEAYYASSSAGPTLAGVRRPALVLSAVNDPVVPCAMFGPHHGLRGFRFLHPSEGGHCGYWQTGSPRFWAARAILSFLGA